jgi:hypothetical protein
MWSCKTVFFHWNFFMTYFYAKISWKHLRALYVAVRSWLCKTVLYTHTYQSVWTVHILRVYRGVPVTAFRWLQVNNISPFFGSRCYQPSDLLLFYRTQNDALRTRSLYSGSGSKTDTYSARAYNKARLVVPSFNAPSAGVAGSCAGTSCPPVKCGIFFSERSGRTPRLKKTIVRERESEREKTTTTIDRSRWCHGS